MPRSSSARPFIVGIGGTASANSSTEQALAIALASAERAGAEVSFSVPRPWQRCRIT